MMPASLIALSGWQSKEHRGEQSPAVFFYAIRDARRIHAGDPMSFVC